MPMSISGPREDHEYPRALGAQNEDSYHDGGSNLYHGHVDTWDVYIVYYSRLKCIHNRYYHCAIGVEYEHCHAGRVGPS